MSELDILRAEAEIGESARQFIESDIGRFILGRAQAEVDEHMQALKTVDPDDEKAIRKHQNAIYRAESIVQWIVEAIEAGDEAITTFQESEEIQ